MCRVRLALLIVCAFASFGQINYGGGFARVSRQPEPAGAGEHPVVATVGLYQGTNNATTHNMTMPNGIVAGDLLFGILRVASGGAIDWPSGGTDVDWTEIADGSFDTSNDQISIAWRLADGDEATTIAVISAANSRSAGFIYRISGAIDPTTTPPTISTVAVNATAVVDPTIVDPSAGTKDYLFLWVGSWEGEQTSPPAGAPTDYLGARGASSGTSGPTATNCRVGMADRQLTAASEDPPSWTISVADSWTAWAVAVHPD